MASSSAHTRRLTTPSLATILVIVSCCTQHFALAARELTPAGDDKAMRERYEKWMAEHGRTYKDSTEKARRFEIFKSNNGAASGPRGKSSAGLATNKFADLTEEEFRAIYLGRHEATTHGPVSRVIEKEFMYADVRLEDIPASIDWREKGAVTPVKDQSEICECCWAFSAVAAVEGIHQITTNNLVSLSEQQLLDCSIGRNNRGCGRGDAEEAFRYIARNGGITTSSSYVFEGNQSTCRSSGKQVAATIRGFQRVPPHNETALMLAVAHQPVSVALDGTAFYSWSGTTGIYGAAGETCKTELNHAMTIVGYGTGDDGTKYWLMKNSWGSRWADQGYVKIARDVASKNGVCGLAKQASYPVA